MASPTKPRVRVAYSVLPIGALYFHCENQDIPPIGKTARLPHEPDFYAWIEPVIAPPATEESQVNPNLPEPTTPAPHLTRVNYSELPIDSIYYRSPNGGVAYGKRGEKECDQKKVYVYRKPGSKSQTAMAPLHFSSPVKELMHDEPTPTRHRHKVEYGTLEEGDLFYLRQVKGTEWRRGAARDEDETRIVWIESARGE